MSDPYNSAGSQFGAAAVANAANAANVPTQSAYVPAPPAAGAQPPARPYDPIARLDVSDTWKKRFRAIERAGGPDLHDFRLLSASERSGLNFNWLAFLFGPFYFIAKGLWRQAIAYSLIAISIGLVLDAMTGGRLTGGLGVGVGVMYAMRANVSYYRLKVLGEGPWL